MKKLKPVKVTSNVARYRIKEMASIDTAFVEALDWSADVPWLVIDFKAQALRPGKMPRLDISRKYNLMLGCIEGKVLKVPAPCPEAGITARPPKSKAEVKKVLRAAFLQYVKSLGKRLGPAFEKNYRQFENSMVKSAEALVILKDGKPCGLFAFVPHTDVYGRKFCHITWHNFFSPLTPGQRRSAQRQAVLWLKKNAKQRLSVALDLYLKEYYEFFAGLGFSVSSLWVERRA